MPGLIAIVSQDSEQIEKNRQIVKTMTNAVLHEPFYSHRFAEIPELGLVVSVVSHGFKTDPGQQSHWERNEGEVECFFSGELSPPFVAGTNLSGHSATVSGRACAAYIKALYRSKGDSFLGQLNGTFSLLVADRDRNRILFAGDRLGMQRVYHGEVAGTFVLAPELKCFRLHPDFSLSLNEEAIAHKLRYNCFYEDETYFCEVKRLPVASKVEFKGSRAAIRPYWTPAEGLALSEGEFLKEALSQFERVVGSYFTPGRTGLSLTGGWDTRAILSAFANRGLNLPCYTFGGVFRDSRDVMLARRLAELCGNPYGRITLGHEYLGEIRYWALKAINVSDGLTTVSRGHEYYLNLQARKFGEVRLTGKYGSQLIRGVSLLKDRSPDHRIFSVSFGEFYENSSRIPQHQSLADVIRFEISQHESSAQSQEMAALTIRTPYVDNGFVDLMLQAPKNVDTSLLQRRIIERNMPSWGSIPTNRGSLIQPSLWSGVVGRWYKALNFLDMVYNWERLPDLPMRVFDSIGNTGFNAVFRGQYEWNHYRLWFKRELSEFLRDVILDPCVAGRGYYNRPFLEKIVTEHVAGKRNYTQEIDKILSLELWMRLNDGLETLGPPPTRIQ